MKDSYYLGNMKNDAKNGGNHDWFVGEFVENDSVRQSDLVELKYWEFKPGPTGHAKKSQTTLEITILLEGELIGEIGGEPIYLHPNEYVVIKPGVESNVAMEAVTQVRGLTIKAPSDVNNKTEVKR